MKVYEICDDAKEDFSALLDGDLPQEEVEALEDHLGECADCLRELDGLKKVQSAYGGLPKVSAPDGFKVNLREKPLVTKVAFGNIQRRTKTGSYKPLMAAAVMLLMIGSLWGVIRTTPENESIPAAESVESTPIFNVAVIDDEDSGGGTGTDEVSAMKSMAADAAVPSESASIPVALEGIPESKQLEESTARSFASPVEPERTFTSKRVGNLDFWTQDGYGDETLVELSPKAPELKLILSENPNLAKIVNIVHDVIFEYDGVWYHVTK